MGGLSFSEEKEERVDEGWERGEVEGKVQKERRKGGETVIGLEKILVN